MDIDKVMIQFSDYIQNKYNIVEDEFIFQKGRDQDYMGHPSEVLVFAEKEPDEYQVRGKTHGQMSHAIKHLIEYDPQYVISVTNRAKKALIQFIQRRPQYFCKIWDEVRGFSKESGIEAIERCDTTTLLNTLDVINDKNQLKTPFTKVDGEIKKYGMELENKYNEIIKDKLHAAYVLEKAKNKDYKSAIAKNPVITFKAVDGNGKWRRVWLDFRDGTVIIGNFKNGKTEINTMYRLNDVGTNKASMIKKFYTKRLRPLDPDIDKALSNGE